MVPADPRRIIDNGSMSGFQIVAVAICIWLNALDGFDVLAITFAAPGISKEWMLGSGALGVVIATGLAGMIVGSLLLAPFADVIGRRRVIIICLLAMTVGMLLSASAESVYSLALWRIITGVGLGGMLAALTAMVAEFSNDRYRNLCVILMGVGYPLGGVLGGMAAAWLLRHYDWRSVFIFGGVVSALSLPLVLWRLPESIDFLVSKAGPRALEQINRLLARMNHAPASALPVTTANEPQRLWDIFSPELAPRTLAVCAAYFFHIMTMYYVLGWLPSIVAALGFPPSTAASVSVWANLGGIVAGLLFGYASRFMALTWLVIIAMLGTAGSLAVFGQTPPDLVMLKAVAFVLGLFMIAGVVSLYAIFTRVFPTRVRVTGTGFSIGVGRLGGVLGPAIGGWLMEAGLGRPSIALFMALGSVIAVLATLSLRSALQPSAVEARQPTPA